MNNNEDDDFNHADRRRASVPVEKMAGFVISGAALAFAVYTAGTTYLDNFRNDLNTANNERAVIIARFAAYEREREQWIIRVLELERQLRDVRERMGPHNHDSG
jgi:hypothetical protein